MFCRRSSSHYAASAGDEQALETKEPAIRPAPDLYKTLAWDIMIPAHHGMIFVILNRSTAVMATSFVTSPVSFPSLSRPSITGTDQRWNALDV